MKRSGWKFTELSPVFDSKTAHVPETPAVRSIDDPDIRRCRSQFTPHFLEAPDVQVLLGSDPEPFHETAVKARCADPCSSAEFRDRQRKMIVRVDKLQGGVHCSATQWEIRHSVIALIARDGP